MKILKGGDLKFEERKGYLRGPFLELFEVKGVNKPISILKVKIPKNSVSEPHYHREVTEIFYIVRGEGNIDVNGQIAWFEAGDLMIVEPGETHALAAREEVILIAIKIPDVAGDRWRYPSN